MVDMGMAASMGCKNAADRNTKSISSPPLNPPPPPPPWVRPGLKSLTKPNCVRRCIGDTAVKGRAECGRREEGVHRKEEEDEDEEDEEEKRVSPSHRKGEPVEDMGAVSVVACHT